VLVFKDNSGFVEGSIHTGLISQSVNFAEPLADIQVPGLINDKIDEKPNIWMGARKI
jgi:hypothetical protein